MQPRIFDQVMFAEAHPLPGESCRSSYHYAHVPAAQGNLWNWYGTPEQSMFSHFGASHAITDYPTIDQTSALSPWSPEGQSQSVPSSGHVSLTDVSTPTVALRPILPTASKSGRTPNSKIRVHTEKNTKASYRKNGRRGSGNATAGNPGPIPASQPRVVEEMPNGDRMIEFEYNKKKNRKMWRIKANLDAVDINTLDEDFKSRNATYPKTAEGTAAVKKRSPYENDCNDTAWRLVALNPELDSQRGLIQRAVDSYRNTHPNPTFHSRRVKRQRRSSNNLEKPQRDSAELAPVCGPPGPTLPSLPDHSSGKRRAQPLHLLARLLMLMLS